MTDSGDMTEIVFFPTERGSKSVRHELNPPVLLIVRYHRNTRVVVMPSCRRVGRNGTARTVGPVTPHEWWCPSRGLSCRELGGHKSYRQGIFIHIGIFSSSATFNLWPGSDRHLYFHRWATCACVCWHNFAHSRLWSSH